MQLVKKENYTLITPEGTSVKKFHDALLKKPTLIESEHLIIDFSEKFNITNEEILLFLNMSTVKRKNGTSFVLIVSGIDIDEIPNEINVVPTIIEAIDVLEMEAIERELGF